MALSGEKLKALETALAQIEKQCGKGSIMRLGENQKMEVKGVSTGSLSLDMALGIGGVPRGRIIEIYGPESSGKTTVALHIIGEVQKAGGEAAFIDAEHALDPVYAKALGVDIDSLLVSQPDSGEQALEITEALVRSGAIECVVVDSVAALVPKSEIDGDMGASHVGLHARLMSQALRKLSGAISKSNCVVVFINQLREKVGIVYGNPEVTTGGAGAQVLRFRPHRYPQKRNHQVGADVVGNHVKCKVVKNKVAPPFKTAEFDIIYGRGISKESEIIEIGVKLGIVEKSGSWFSYNGSKLGQGKDTVRELLVSNPSLAAEIEARIREKLSEVKLESEPDADPDVDAETESELDGE